MRIGNNPAMPQIDTDSLITVTNAARVAGVSRFWMLSQAKSGKVASVTVDGVRFVYRSAAEAFVRDPVRGRPRAMSAG
jgi:hypothetical protein